MSPFIESFTARSYEQDGYGHVNHAVYLNYFEHARWRALQAAGIRPDHLHARGWSVVVARLEVEYRKPLRMGDRFAVRTSIGAMTRARVTFEQALVRVGEDRPSATARVEAAWVDERGRPIRVPEAVRAALSPEALDENGGRRR